MIVDMKTLLLAYILHLNTHNFHVPQIPKTFYINLIPTSTLSTHYGTYNNKYSIVLVI
jgi:hypothetical protein